MDDFDVLGMLFILVSAAIPFGLALLLIRHWRRMPTPPKLILPETALRVETPSSRTCPLCGDDLDASVDATRAQRAIGITNSLNGMKGVTARVHARQESGLCFSVAFKQSETSQRDYAQIIMLHWQMEHPDTTVYLTGAAGEVWEFGPLQEAR